MSNVPMPNAPLTASDRGARRTRISWWWLPAAMAVAFQLWGVYRVQPPPTDPALPGLDKLGHFVAFGLPVLLVCVALDRTRRLRRVRPIAARRLIGVVAAVALAHAVVSEIVQGVFYAERTGDPLDVLADAVGVGLGSLLAWWAVRDRETTMTGRRR